MLSYLEQIGCRVVAWLNTCAAFFKLFGETLYWIVWGPFRKRPVNRVSTFEQMVFMGSSSIVIVFFVTFFTGIVLAMQSAYQLSKMGATIYVASLVAISICRELGPVLTALVIAGRVGSAITAEIASMKVNEQLEALETMAIHPVRYLVVPKFLALLIMLPCLTVIGDVAGMIGGYIIGVYSLKINAPLYLQTMFDHLTLKDIYTGISKSFVFAMIIAMVGAFQGFQTKGGAVGVGRSTTVSVVASFILIIIADVIMTAFYYFSNL